MEITLIAASVDTPSTSGVNAESRNLISTGSLVLAPRTIARSYTAYPADDFIWSASAANDGSFSYDAVPQKNSGSSYASNQWNSLSSTRMSGSDWHTRNAIFQYALHAGMPTPTNGQLINLYA
jgi:hypothetical protein